MSLELRNCFPYDATNLGQFLSDHFHIAYGTFYRYCECFYRKSFLNCPSPLAPAPFFGYFGVYVRTYDATNLGQFLSDHFHIAYGTFYRHCECFYRKKFLNRPSPLAPAPFLGILGCTYVRTMPLILANSYQFTSILHTVLSTVTVSVFIERKNLNRPSPLAPSPFFGYFGVFFSETLGHRFQPI